MLARMALLTSSSLRGAASSGGVGARIATHASSSSARAPVRLASAGRAVWLGAVSRTPPGPQPLRMLATSRPRSFAAAVPAVAERERVEAPPTLVEISALEEDSDFSEPEVEGLSEVGAGSEDEALGRRRTFSEIFGSNEPTTTSVPEGSLMVGDAGLSPVTVAALEARGIQALFPVQRAVLEPAMAGRDLLARARTGSGKTLAFALPIAERIMRERAAAGEGRPRSGRKPYALVLAPTRELAIQVERELSSVSPTLAVASVYGGAAIAPQSRELRSGVDVVVGTPGRVQDLMGRGDLVLSELRVAVLDEADQMLSQGFAEDVEAILRDAPADRQTLLFSATTPTWIARLAKTALKNPATVDLVGGAGGGTGRLADSVTPYAVRVTPQSRRSVLVDLLTVHGAGAGGKAIVFCATKRETDEVAAAVAAHLPGAALHGDMTQTERNKVLDGFRKGSISALVATDVAARGLDVPDVDLVVHYDLPNDTESFLHRSGRTGRAGRKGTAIAMYTRRDQAQLARLLKSAKARNATTMTAPAPRAIMEAAARAAAARLDATDPEVVDAFRSAADAVLAHREPREALAAALASLSGLASTPTRRSLLTTEEDMRTLVLSGRRVARGAHAKEIVDATLASADLHPEDASLGRIRVLPDGAGVAFDLPHKGAQALLDRTELVKARGAELHEPAEVPPEPLDFDVMLGSEDRFGSRSPRGGRQSGYGNRQGGGYGGRGRTSGRDSWGQRGSNGGRDQRAGRDGGFNRDRRSGGSGGGAGGGGYRPRRNDDEW